MIPDSIILLTPERRLDVLLDALADSLVHAKVHGTEDAWNTNIEAWKRLHAELMSQVDQPTVLTKPDDIQSI